MKLVNSLAWRIKFSDEAVKSLSKLDKHVAKQVYRAIQQLAALENPRDKGKALTGQLRGLWRYRIGDYRVVCLIEDDELIVLVLGVGHRRQIYG